MKNSSTLKAVASAALAVVCAQASAVTTDFSYTLAGAPTATNGGSLAISPITGTDTTNPLLITATFTTTHGFNNLFFNYALQLSGALSPLLGPGATVTTNATLDGSTNLPPAVNTLVTSMPYSWVGSGYVAGNWTAGVHTITFFGSSFPGATQMDLSSLSLSAVPEPQALALTMLALGVAGFAGLRRQGKAQAMMPAAA